MVKERYKSGEEEMKEFDKRIFKCINGHEYESKEPISPPGLDYGKANNKCIICGDLIFSETDYYEGKPVAGCMLPPEFYPKILKLKAQKAGGKTNGKSKRYSSKL